MHSDIFVQNYKGQNLQSAEIPLTHLFVRPTYLNIRNSPKNGDLRGTLFQGQKVPIFARKGDWYAITRPLKFHETLAKPLWSFGSSEETYWINASYLTPHRTKPISHTKLEAKCSYMEIANYMHERGGSMDCESVHHYLKQYQNYASMSTYEQKLFAWLKANDRKREMNKVQSNCY